MTVGMTSFPELTFTARLMMGLCVSHLGARGESGGMRRLVESHKRRLKRSGSTVGFLDVVLSGNLSMKWRFHCVEDVVACISW